MRVDAKNETELLEASGPYKQVLSDLDRLIRRVAPKLKPEFFDSGSMTMLAYGLTPYKYASGREGVWPLIALAPQKNNAALYVCALKDGKYFAEIHQKSLGKVSCGKNCIRFKKAEDLNMAGIEAMIRDVYEEYLTGKKLFGI